LPQRQIRTLSGGERQRVAIASALALQPNILVLDEPTSQLDPQSAEEVLQAIVRLNQEQGMTIILAEHRLERVLPFADRLVVVEGGEITADVEVKGSRGASLRLQGQGSVASLTGAGERRQSMQPTLRIALEVKGVGFAYEGKAALQDVNLSVAAGEAVAVMWRNGAGKSTLLKCVVGLLSAESGEVWVNGRSTHRRTVADICREVAYLPQNPDDLLFADSVTEELAITLRNHAAKRQGGSGAGEQGKTIEGLLRELRLVEYGEAYPRDLSVGQRQRVALGAVMVTQPPLLLLDEPTRGLDSAAKENLIAIWQRWLARGVGLLLVTHDVELVARTADRTIILDEGKIIAEGETAEILAHFYPDHGWLRLEEILDMTHGT
jgi:energy-coupling factor transport system ATP-binding protein